MELMEFVFSSFWVFFGTLWLIYAAFCGVARVVAAWRHGKLEI